MDYNDILMHHYTSSDFLCHHGIIGQRWGIRRFQNKDGSLTAAGKKRYGDSDSENEKAQSLKSAGINERKYAGHTFYSMNGMSSDGKCTIFSDRESDEDDVSLIKRMKQLSNFTAENSSRIKTYANYILDTYAKDWDEQKYGKLPSKEEFSKSLKLHSVMAYRDNCSGFTYIDTKNVFGGHYFTITVNGKGEYLEYDIDG